MTAPLQKLNTLPATDARAEFLRCCGSTRWAEAMSAARPFTNASHLLEAADSHWRATTASDWLEAFSHHPRIGERSLDNARFAATAKWSQQEQGSMSGVDQEIKSRLDALNREYEDRFGFVFLICATGRSAPDMLQSLEQRLRNGREQELRNAAAEQAKIMRLRLEKLLAADPVAPTSLGGAA